MIHDMVTHMKTTVDIGDALFEQAKRVAQVQGTTLRELIESGLRHELQARQSNSVFRLKSRSFLGGGLQPDFQEGDWAKISAAAYEGRG